MYQNWLVLRQCTVQQPPKGYDEKLLSFEHHIIKVWEHAYPSHLIGNTDRTSLSFDVPSNVTVNKKGEKSLIHRTSGSEKSRITGG
jgi:hypothetical protein